MFIKIINFDEFLVTYWIICFKAASARKTNIYVGFSRKSWLLILHWILSCICFWDIKFSFSKETIKKVEYCSQEYTKYTIPRKKNSSFALDLLLWHALNPQLSSHFSVYIFSFSYCFHKIIKWKNLFK